MEFRASESELMQRGSGEDETFHSLSVWTPNVNIFRDPRWGRGQETYGEDPYLTSVMGVQVVRVCRDLKRLNIVSCGLVPSTMPSTAVLSIRAIRLT